MRYQNYFSHYRFIIQWHITERCNWSCLHCYQNTPNNGELQLKELKQVFKKCLKLFQILRIPKKKAYINITGGEPFLRDDFFHFLKFLKRYTKYINISVMTNGSFYDDKKYQLLEKYGVERIQISIEGLKKTNDFIRGKGSFDTIIQTLKHLDKKNFLKIMSITLTRMNVKEIRPLAAYLKNIGVNRLGIRRYVPIGKGEKLREEMLSPLELKSFFYLKERLRRKLQDNSFTISYGCEDAIFYSYKNINHKCAVMTGDLITIMANGDIVPCRRLPIILGNALNDDIFEIYFLSDILNHLREIKNLSKLCQKCKYFPLCLSGARCVAYAYFNNLFAPDPQCWRLFKQLPKTR